MVASGDDGLHRGRRGGREFCGREPDFDSCGAGRVGGLVSKGIWTVDAFDKRVDALVSALATVALVERGEVRAGAYCTLRRGVASGLVLFEDLAYATLVVRAEGEIFHYSADLVEQAESL